MASLMNSINYLMKKNYITSTQTLKENKRGRNVSQIIPCGENYPEIKADFYIIGKENYRPIFFMSLDVKI